MANDVLYGDNDVLYGDRRDFVLRVLDWFFGQDNSLVILSLPELHRPHNFFDGGLYSILIFTNTLVDTVKRWSVIRLQWSTKCIRKKTAYRSLGNFLSVDFEKDSLHLLGGRKLFSVWHRASRFDR